MAGLCREFGISRKTGYIILTHYNDIGLDGLTDRSRRPYRHANQLPTQIETLIVRLKQDKPSWGAPKIRERLARLYPDVHTPAISTVHVVPDRRGLVKRRTRRRNRAEGTTLSRPAQPNELWCADYKGEFMLARRYRYPLTIVWGAMAWGGQWCTSPGYAYVHESVADLFVAEAKRALVEMFGSDPKNNPDYSRIIGTREAQRLHALIDQSKVVAGGAADPEARYVAPTILYPITWEHEIMEDEIFGPILPILTYTDFDDALARIADKPAPLAAFIFSTRQDHIDRFIGSLSYGGGAVNQVNIHLFIESMPFGGVGPAGMGHYYGRYGFEALTHAKSMLIAPDGVAIDHLIPPYDRSKVEALSMWFDYPSD